LQRTVLDTDFELQLVWNWLRCNWKAKWYSIVLLCTKKRIM